MLRLSILASLILAAMTACTRGNGPAEELRSLFEMLANPQVSPSRLGTQLYKALDDEAREAVDARAAALSERLGVKVDPSEVLQVHGLSPGQRVSGLTAKVEDETQATLEVSFAPIEFTAGSEGAGSAAATRPAPTAIRVVRQGGRWRVVLADLAKLLEKIPLDAKSADGRR